MKRLSYLAMIAIFALLLVATAWAQTQDQEGQDQDQGQDQNQGRGEVAVPVPEARSIDIRDNRFEPTDATVAPGTTLMWINYDQPEGQHTVTADDGQFDSGVLDPGGIFVVTVEGSGKLTYHCELHTEMKGRVTVGEGGEAGEATTKEAATDEENIALDPPTGEAPPAEETSVQEAPAAEETSIPEGPVA